MRQVRLAWIPAAVVVLTWMIFLVANPFAPPEGPSWAFGIASAGCCVAAAAAIAIRPRLALGFAAVGALTSAYLLLGAPVFWAGGLAGLVLLGLCVSQVVPPARRPAQA